MRFRPEEWNACLLARGIRSGPPPLALQALHRTLRTIPDATQKTLADLGSGPDSRFGFLTESYGRVAAVSALPDSPARKDRFDVVLAVDSIAGPRPADIDRVLRGIYGHLAEGGLLVATFAAASRFGGPVRMPLLHEDERETARSFHEVELQYRMQSAGFQAVHIRRFHPEQDRSGTLLAVAVRRVQN